MESCPPNLIYGYFGLHFHNLQTASQSTANPSQLKLLPPKEPAAATMSSFLARRAAFAPSALRAFSTTSPRGLARITIVGNLGDSPELVPTSTGHEVIKYSVASSTGPRENRHTSWFRVSTFLREGDEKRRDFLLSIPKGYVPCLSYSFLSLLDLRCRVRRVLVWC